MSRITMKDVTIAVIGESMAGKTTWITSLFNKDVNVELRALCKGNEKGQTKIKTYYELENPEKGKIEIKEVVCDYEKLLEYGEKKVLPQQIKLFFEEIGFDLLQFIELENSEGRKEVGNDEYAITLDTANIELESFFKQIVNNPDKVITELVRYITISGPAHERVWGIMTEAGVERFKVCDTRGFFDETEEEIQRLLKSQKGEKQQSTETGMKEEITRRLYERGISEADACVLVYNGGDALKTEIHRQMYSGFFEEVTKSIPTFLVIRNDLIKAELKRKWKVSPEAIENMDFYRECMQVDDNGSFVGILEDVTTHQSIRELLQDCGMFDYENSGYRSKLAKKNYKQLVVAGVKIKNVPKEKSEEEQEYYLYTAHGAFSEIVESVMQYKSEMQAIESALNSYQDKTRIIRFFRETGKEIIQKNNYLYPGVGMDNYLFRRVYVRDIADAVRRKTYNGFGGMVGIRGGVTTRVKEEERNVYPSKHYVGDYAIDLLEAAFELFIKVAEKFADELEKVLPDELFLKSDKDTVKGQYLQYFRNIANANEYTYCCCKRPMLKLFLLENIWHKTISEFKLDSNDYTIDDSDIAIMQYMLSEVIICLLEITI